MALLDLNFINLITGLRPQAWLCVGSGYSREDFKTLVLNQGRGFVAEAVTTPQEICLKILDLPKERVLTPSARQEILRLFLAEKRIIGNLRELKRIRRQLGFVKSLDSAIQAGRMAFAHPQEEEVYLERLGQVFGDQPLRQELRAFTAAYEAWLESSGWWDLPLLFKRTIESLRDRGWPEKVRKPQIIHRVSVNLPESLEREFWDVLGSYVQVSPLDQASEKAPMPDFAWQRWHTLEDAAESFTDELLRQLDERKAEGTEAFVFDHHAVLIPDIPGVRRALKRTLEMRGIPLAEPRDPTQVKSDEALKMGLLPLQVVGRGFERSKVIAWLRAWLPDSDEQHSAWVKEIHARGIRSGLKAYQGGTLEVFYSQLESLQTLLGGRKNCRESGNAHLQLFKDRKESHPKLNQIYSVFESIWNAMAEDFERIGQGDRKAPFLFWLERLESRLREASPPIEALKPREGLRLYRLQQAPVLEAETIWLFGLPPRWLGGEGAGDFWFSERDREILSNEFAVRSRFQVREERLKVLTLWLRTAQKVILLESEFDSTGRERETLLPLVKELAQHVGWNLPDAPESRGAHARTLQSYSAARVSHPTRVQLPPLEVSATGQPAELSATLIDRSSRCGFQALVFHRWKLKDIREPGTELWPDVRGTLLHDAVRILMLSRNSAGHFGVQPSAALDEAWRRQRPQGLVRTQRVESYVRSRLVRVLDVFCEKEREYFLRAQTRPVSLDDLTLRVNYPDFSIRGKPDRIDQGSEGLFIMDYKSAGTVPHGQDILEHGYRLQLPFYAIAAARQLNQEILGVQFVELDSKGARRSGIHFTEFNGKEPGKLTQLRSNSKSLFNRPREEVWADLEDQMIQVAKAYVAGQFEARPRMKPAAKECSSCRVGDLCGVKRRTDDL